MIIREQVNLNNAFMGPAELTFGWQEERKAFSVWFKINSPRDRKYAIVGTGDNNLTSPIKRLVATIVLPDGFHAFHLVELT